MGLLDIIVRKKLTLAGKMLAQKSYDKAKFDKIMSEVARIQNLIHENKTKKKDEEVSRETLSVV